jgi:hypothetical protein
MVCLLELSSFSFSLFDGGHFMGGGHILVMIVTNKP